MTPRAIGNVKADSLTGFSQAAEVSPSLQVLEDAAAVVVVLLSVIIRLGIVGTGRFNIDATLLMSSAAASANGTRLASLTIFANR
jgi:hypothetical protein